MYQGEGWLILSREFAILNLRTSVSRGGVVDSQPHVSVYKSRFKCIKGRGG